MHPRDRLRASRLLRPLALVLVVAAAPSLRAQAAADAPAARIVVIRPRPGQQAAFEAGYRRHLEWHRAAKDPWTWFGWTVVLGPEPGLFMDGTFGHAWRDLDRAVEPAADAADNATNVTPWADFLSHAVYERLSAPSGASALPDSSPFMVLVRYRVAAGRGDEFEALVRRRTRPGSGTWYRAVLGTEGAEYLYLRSARGFVDLERRHDPLASAPAEAAPLLRGVTTQLLRYRRDLSYSP